MEEKLPCCETFPLDEGTRDDDTPAYLKRFLHEIAPEKESDEGANVIELFTAVSYAFS